MCILRKFPCRCSGVLIKYCINFLQNCSTSLLFVCDWSIRSEVKSNSAEKNFMVKKQEISKVPDQVF